MVILSSIGLGVLVVGCCCWFLILMTTVYNLRKIMRIENLQVPQRTLWPKLSLIIPACNEGNTLEAAMRSRLRSTYPNLEIILVNDRSTDNTGDIGDSLAQTDARLRVVHVHTLPEGWLGKVHALQQGIENSTGEWFLFMDADVHIEPGILERVVGWCEERNLDQVTLMPRLKAATFVLGIVNSYFLRAAITALPICLIESQKSRLAAGAGVFNLFRRTALERTPGMARLRLEVIDDSGLSILLKARGARSSLINGAGGVSLSWYPSLGAMMNGFEKNGFAIVNYSVTLLLVACFALVLLEWSPYLALAQAKIPWLRTLGAVTVIINLAVSAAISRWAHQRVVTALLAPIAAPIFAFLLLRAGFLTLWRGGIVWRGTKYALRTLKEFRRNGENMPLQTD